MNRNPFAVGLARLGLGLLAAVVPAARAQESAPPEVGGFTLTIPPGARAEPYSGRVYVVLSRGAREPRTEMWDWFSPPQVFAADVRDLSPGTPFTIRGAALGFPAAWEQVEEGDYRAQAVARVNPDSCKPGAGKGDLYSPPVNVNFHPGAEGELTLTLDRAVTERPFRETERFKLVEIRSPSLSAFHGRDVMMRAGVMLPAGHTAGNPPCPTLYFITGFGGDHRGAAMIARALGPRGDRVMIVSPDPTCYRGHNVFADSANNGPWGRALVEELIPAVEEKYNPGAGASRRYVTGISSGGWSSLWLQVTYPDTFAGVWSHCPDPVDFRDFQRIDLYAPGANMYTDAEGKPRPVTRPLGGRDPIWYRDFVRQETVMGPGGQIHSFEAVFSPRGDDAEPRPLFDRETGAVDAATAKAWEAYDIRLVLERNWESLGPRLKGKLHVYAGELDTFYLEGAARRLKESLESLKSDAQVVIVPGMPHTIAPAGIASMMDAIVGPEKPVEAPEPERPAPGAAPR